MDQHSEKRLDNFSFTSSFPQDYLPYTNAYHRRAPYLVWDDGYNPHRKYKRKKCHCHLPERCCCCSWSTAAVTAVAGFLIFSLFALVAVSAYLGVLTSLFSSQVLPLRGRLRVKEGDQYVPSLANSSSPEFQAKAAKYERAIRSVYSESNVFKDTVVKTEVYAFREGSLLIFFRIYLDRRKLEENHTESPSEVAKDVLQAAIQNNTSNSYFAGLRIDSLQVSDNYIDDLWPSPASNDTKSDQQDLMGVLPKFHTILPYDKNKKPKEDEHEDNSNDNDQPSTPNGNLVFRYGPWTPYYPSNVPQETTPSTYRPKSTSPPTSSRPIFEYGHGKGEVSEIHEEDRDYPFKSTQHVPHPESFTRSPVRTTTNQSPSSSKPGTGSVGVAVVKDLGMQVVDGFFIQQPPNIKRPQRPGIITRPQDNATTAIIRRPSESSQSSGTRTGSIKPGRGEVRLIPEISVGTPLVITNPDSGRPKGQGSVFPLANPVGNERPKQNPGWTLSAKQPQPSSGDHPEVSVGSTVLRIQGGSNKGQPAPKEPQPPPSRPESEVVPPVSDMTVGASLFIRIPNRNRSSVSPLTKHRMMGTKVTTSTTTTTRAPPVSQVPSRFISDVNSGPLLFVRGSSKGQAFVPLRNVDGLAAPEEMRMQEPVSEIHPVTSENSTVDGQSSRIPNVTATVRTGKNEKFDDVETEIPAQTRSDDNDHIGGVPKYIPPYLPSKPGSQFLNEDEISVITTESEVKVPSNSLGVVTHHVTKVTEPVDDGRVSISTIYRNVTDDHVTTTTTVNPGNELVTSKPTLSEDTAPSPRPNLFTVRPQRRNSTGSRGQDVMPTVSTTPAQTCNPKDHFRCNSGECLPKSKKCDRKQDCKDGSDEKNCTCISYLRKERLHRKICDGVVDCWDFTDENRCSWCSPYRVVCPGAKKCIEPTQVCDGINDCPDGSDENYCVKLAKDLESATSLSYQDEGFLMIQRKGRWGALCFDGGEDESHKWRVEDVGHAVCSALTFKEASSVKSMDSQLLPEGAFFRLGEARQEGIGGRLKSQFYETTCRSKNVVHVKCGALECGMRPLLGSLRRRIVGGQSSSVGSWPWQVALYREGEFQCGGVLINDRWVLSAGHCFYHTVSSYWTSRLGVLRRGSQFPSPFEQHRRITHIFIHPAYQDKGFINDIALLRLESSVQFSDYIRPICLPEASENITAWHGQLCTTVGWGKLFEIGRIFPDTLQEVRLPIISTEECRKRTLFLPLYKITDDMFCAGFERGGRDACLGDSGGPMMCQKSDGRWTLLGVTSNGDGCGRAGRPGVYSKVSGYLEWIRATLENPLPPELPTVCLGHRCPLGKCLREDKVCDGTMDCRDDSDERYCAERVVSSKKRTNS